MTNCNFRYGVKQCDKIATTTLKKNNGEEVQLCEEHRLLLINLAKSIAGGEVDVDLENAEEETTHWLVINRIPS
jgi:hypothetical protein